MYLPKSIIIVGSILLILYFNCIINLKHIYIQTEHVNNKINQYTYTQTEHVLLLLLLILLLLGINSSINLYFKPNIT